MELSRGEIVERSWSRGRQPVCMDFFDLVEEQASALRGSVALNEALRRWKARREELRSFGDAEGLIGFLRDSEAGGETLKDAALAAVSIEAAHGDKLAGTLLLWLILPGLARVRRRLGAWEALPPEDLDAELVAGVWEAATRIRPDTSRVAARLVNRARWRALAAMRRAIDWGNNSEPLPSEPEDLPPPSGPTPILSDRLLAAAVADGVISEDEAELLSSSRRTSREIRARMGITAYAAQNRRRRAKKRLLTWLVETSRLPPRFLHTATPRKLHEESTPSADKERP